MAVELANYRHPPSIPRFAEYELILIKVLDLHARSTRLT
jgi:hypothetical protein